MNEPNFKVPASALARQLDRWLALATEPLAAAATVAEVVILLTGVISRFGFNHPLVWSDELATITFLWLGMFGAAIALRRGQHMRMTALLDRFDGATRGVMEAIGSVAPALFLVIVLLAAVRFAQDQSYVHTPALGLNDAFRASALPVGVALMLAASLIRCLQIIARAKSLSRSASSPSSPSPSTSRRGDLRDRQLEFRHLLCSHVGGRRAGRGADRFLLWPLHCRLFARLGDSPLEVIPGRIDEGVSSIILLAVPLFILLGAISSL